MKTHRVNHNKKDGYKKNYKQNGTNAPQDKFKSKKPTFIKNTNGFLIVSLFITKETPFNDIVNSINSALAIDHKKKVIISFEDQQNIKIISSIQSKFANVFGAFFFNYKGKLSENSTTNSSKIQTEVLKSFKSSLFLTLTSNVEIRKYSIEKMISFLSKDDDVFAVAPKFYSDSSEIVKTCRRFFSIWNFLPEFSNFIKNKNLEHFMMERGEVGYYSIHRIDYSTLDCMLFITDQLNKVKSFSSRFKNADLRDASFCQKLYKKTKGKIMFYPHSRVLLKKNNFSEKPEFYEKLKYFFL